jgi:ATP-binding cassette subfamily B protein/subfamily B ATP-binding cassette protein MsbA
VFALCRRLSRYARRHWGAALAVLGATLLTTAVNVLLPWPTKVLVDNVLSEKPLPDWLATAFEALPGDATREHLLDWTVVAGVVLFMLSWGINTARLVAGVTFGQRMTYDLAADLFAHLQRLSLRFHSRRTVGDSLRRVTADSSCVATIVQEAALPVVSSILSLGAMFVVMWALDPGLTLIAAGVAPVLVWILRAYARPMIDRSYQQHEAEGRMYATVEQTLTAIPVVQAYAGETERERRFRRDASDALDAVVRTTNLQLVFKVLTATTTGLGTAAVVWLGARHALDNQLTIGTILVFLAYLAALYGPLEALMYASSTIQNAAGSARRVMEVLDSASEVAELPGAPGLVVGRGHVRLEGVSFGYEADRAVLRGVSLEALPGETVAIVGPTGAGKSTLVGLVLRFFDPWSGSVSIDGQDLRDVQLASVRGQVALVLQESFLFPMSIADNIAYGRPGASPEEVVEAAVAANAHGFISRLPDGYDTVVGERGATLSGGERQRVAIARALLKDAPVLILDEPTSALDAETEGLLLEALERLMVGRTTLIIAHRLSTIRNADRIVVLQNGRVAETGTHRQLLNTPGLYARLHAAQRNAGLSAVP